jgi:integrase
MTDLERQAIAFAILTGLRREEVLMTTWQEIDLTAERLMVPGNVMPGNPASPARA